jgi:hypothetical protein
MVRMMREIRHVKTRTLIHVHIYSVHLHVSDTFIIIYILLPLPYCSFFSPAQMFAELL